MRTPQLVFTSTQGSSENRAARFLRCEGRPGNVPLDLILFWVHHPVGNTMLRYSLIFLVIALIASAFGMVSLSGVAMQGARILFFVFVVLLILSFVFGRRNAQL
jgi:uncharacterized membrane protein YtjA (UPF0391 family)